MEEKKKAPARKRGRPARGRLVKSFSVALPVYLHDWAMEQTEGFSGLVQKLLLAAYTREQRKGGADDH